MAPQTGYFHGILPVPNETEKYEALARTPHEVLSQPQLYRA